MSKALKEKSLYPIFTEQNFRDFITKDKESVWECQVASTYSSDRFDEVAILKLSVKDAKAIPFIVLRYNKDIYTANSFGRFNNYLEVDGVYLIDKDTVVFSSDYRSKEIRPLIEDMKIYTAEELVKEMEEHLQKALKEAVAMKRILGVEPDKEYEYESSVFDWYVNGKKPIDFVSRNTELTKTFKNNGELKYIIKYIRGEDIIKDGLQNINIDKYAEILEFVEQKFDEYDKSEDMKRNIELFRILKEDLSNAVTVNVTKKDGTTIKVENNVRLWDSTYKVGRYDKEVSFTDIDCITYKKKTYGKLDPATI
ncbi:hypothetical protein [Bacillus cereus]|uniref:hypothetical protein n=1 Tax=Bacillus cereus TaxID=1396 RepID=UPI000BF80067|nr:hypothetical protein [Bacillus cereus]PFB64357.1 hypothetical protein CN291_16860 [Bacillus cereus]